MTPPDLLVPLRVPEVGPSLGKLVTGTGHNVPGIRLNAFRYQLATRIIEAAGESRRLAANNERAEAIAALGRDTWMRAWEEAVAGVADEFVERMAAHLLAEARAVRMPRTMRQSVDLDERERRALSARFGSAGADLVPVLDDLDSRGGGVLSASGTDRQALDDWQQAVTLAARRLEAAWLTLELAVAQEVASWLGVGREIARWRRPLWPVFVVGSVALAASFWIGLMVGGYVPTPMWVQNAWSGLAPFLDRTSSTIVP